MCAKLLMVPSIVFVVFAIGPLSLYSLLDILIHKNKDLQIPLALFQNTLILFLFTIFVSKPISLKNKGLLNNNNLKYIFLFTCSNLFFRQLLHKVRNKWIWSHQRLTNNFIFKSLFRHYQLQIFGNFLLLNT